MKNCTQAAAFIHDFTVFMYLACSAIRPSSIKGRGPDFCKSCRHAYCPFGVPFYVHFNILHGLCRLDSLRLLLTNEPSIFVDGDLFECIKPSASDRPGKMLPHGSSLDSSKVCHSKELLGFCPEKIVQFVHRIAYYSEVTQANHYLPKGIHLKLSSTDSARLERSGVRRSCFEWKHSSE